MVGHHRLIWSYVRKDRASGPGSGEKSLPGPTTWSSTLRVMVSRSRTEELVHVGDAPDRREGAAIARDYLRSGVIVTMQDANDPDGDLECYPLYWSPVDWSMMEAL
mgnify:CR=1 FL=1